MVPSGIEDDVSMLKICSQSIGRCKKKPRLCGKGLWGYS